MEQYRSAQRRRVWGLEQHRSAQLRRVAQGSTERRHEVVKNTRSPKTTTTGMTTTYNHQHLDYVGAKLKQQPMMSLPPASHSTTPTTSQSTPSMFCITYGGPPLALPPLAALPALPRHPQLHYPTHVGSVNVCLGFPRRSSITLIDVKNSTAPQKNTKNTCFGV